MDVQGFELEVFKGAARCLSFTELVLAEVSFIDVYVDCPLVSEIIEFLNVRNFQLFDIGDFRRRELDNNLWQCDFIFIKKDSFLVSDKRKDYKQIRPN